MASWSHWNLVAIVALVAFNNGISHVAELMQLLWHSWSEGYLIHMQRCHIFFLNIFLEKVTLGFLVDFWLGIYSWCQAKVTRLTPSEYLNTDVRFLNEEVKPRERKRNLPMRSNKQLDPAVKRSISASILSSEWQKAFYRLCGHLAPTGAIWIQSGPAPDPAGSPTGPIGHPAGAPEDLNGSQSCGFLTLLPSNSNTSW